VHTHSELFVDLAHLLIPFQTSPKLVPFNAHKLGLEVPEMTVPALDIV